MTDIFFDIGSALMSRINLPNLDDYKPHEKQRRFHEASAHTRLFVGGNRSGKTMAGTAEGIYHLKGVHPYRRVPPPPTRGRCIGVDFKEGIEMILKPMYQRLVPPSLLKNGSWTDSWTAKTNTLTLTNGSTIEFMSYEQDIEKFAGTSRHFIHFDEEPPHSIFNENKMRIIDTDGEIWITMTPLMGMTWVYKEVYVPGITGLNKDVFVVEVNIKENPHIRQEAVTKAIAGLDEDETKARTEGQFRAIGGLIFPNFNPEIHVIKQPPIHALKLLDWYASMDHGLDNPTAWLWHAVTPDKRIITFHEHYKSGWTVDRHAAYVKARHKEWGKEPEMIIGDPAIKQRNAQTGMSIQGVYAMNDVFIALGNNDVDTGLDKMNTYLNAVNPENGQPKPRWLITEQCVNLVDNMPMYRWDQFASAKLRDENNKKGKPKKKDDHDIDAARYFIATVMPDIPVSELPDMTEVMGKAVIESMLAPTAPYYGDNQVDSFFHTAPHQDSDFSPPDEYMGTIY